MQEGEEGYLVGAYPSRFRSAREPPQLYGSVYPIFRGLLQPSLRLGGGLCGTDHSLRPNCLCDSIIGHGRRRKQAHDENHDWIKIRRGICPPCGLTFTFLPLFSKPYTHYSLVARSEALRRYFLEHCSWDNAAPSIKDPDRIPAPSTLRRWFCRLDSSRSAFSFLRPTMEVVGQWLARGEQLDCGSLRLSWPTLFPFLQVFWPLRL